MTHTDECDGQRPCSTAGAMVEQCVHEVRQDAMAHHMHDAVAAAHTSDTQRGVRLGGAETGLVKC